ncbi:MAG: hypothetical protein QXS91_03160 [Candidatus Anstonellales archaeon]
MPEQKTNIFDIIGTTSFIVGIIACVVYVFLQNNIILISILLFGFIVGLLNITPEEVVKLLVSVTAVIIASEFLKSNLTSDIMPAFITEPLLLFLKALILFLAPVILIVGIKTIFDITRD